MLYTIKDNVAVIPMALNAFYYSIPIGSESIRFAKDVLASENFIKLLVAEMDKIPSEDYIILDLKNIDYCAHSFSRFKKTRHRMVFVNIGDDQSFLQKKIRDDLRELSFAPDNSYACLNCNCASDTIQGFCKGYAGNSEQEVYIHIIKRLADFMEDHDPVKPHLLDSSGLYGNVYIDTKRLFFMPEEYFAVLYGMARMLMDSGMKYDGFISSSKNGAILATALGMFFSKKAIHILGVGPKYSMGTGNLQKDIKRGGNYVYVYDFICTGTEMKILTALVNSNDAYIVGGIGISAYRFADIAQKYNFLCLADTKIVGITYKVAGETEDIELLMREYGNDREVR